MIDCNFIRFIISYFFEKNNNILNKLIDWLRNSTKACNLIEVKQYYYKK